MNFFTKEDLAKHDGKSGSVYVAYKGKVYDVSASFLWEGGNHQDLHQAGRDLTGELQEAPHEDDVLQTFPVVGELKE